MQRRTLLAGLAALMAAPSALARSNSIALTEDQKARLDQANQYLSGLKSVRCLFTQSDPQGNLSSGTLWMRRPGKARFQYDPPAQLLVVSDGANVMVYDRRLKTFDQYALGLTPLGLLLSKDVRLDKGVGISAVVDTGRGFSITAQNVRKPREGSLILDFADGPLALSGWTVVDAQGQRTQVALGQMTQELSLDPRLFTLPVPTGRNGRPG